MTKIGFFPLTGRLFPDGSGVSPKSRIFWYLVRRLPGIRYDALFFFALECDRARVDFFAADARRGAARRGAGFGGLAPSQLRPSPSMMAPTSPPPFSSSFASDSMVRPFDFARMRSRS